MDWLWCLLLGLGTGTVAVLVGAGGGFILLPALLIFFDMEPEIAVGTSLALVAIESVSGSTEYRRLGLVDVRSGLMFAAAAIPGSVLAPFILNVTPDRTFTLLLGGLLFLVAVLMTARGRQSTRALPPDAVNETPNPEGRRVVTRSGEVYEYGFNEALAAGFNGLLGFMSSFFGTGGGFLRTPVLVSFFNFPVRVAVATSVFAITFYAAAGAVTHATLGHIDWYPTLLWTGIGLAVGGQIGARLSPRIRSVWILRLLAALLLAAGIRLILLGILD